MQQLDFMEQAGATRQEQTLSNGIRVVLYERPHMPVSLRAAFRSGARYDGQHEGVAHFVEHMVVSSTQAYPTKDLLAEYIERCGGSFGATTGHEFLRVDVQIAQAEDLPKAAHLFDEMLTRSLFGEQTFETERAAVLGEISNRQASSATALWDEEYKLFFQGGSAGHSVLGTKESVAAISLEDVKAFAESALTTERLTLVVAGGVTIQELADAFQGLQLPTGAPAEASFTPNPRQSPIVINRFPGSNQVDFLFGFRACGFNDHDKYGLELIRTILGAGKAATLTRKLRYEKGLIYSGEAGTEYLAGSGVWFYKSSCAKTALQAVLDTITDEFKRVYEGGLTEAELQFAKDKVTKSLIMDMQTSKDWVAFHTAYEAYRSGETINDYLASIVALSPADIAEIGKKYFAPDAWYLALAGDLQETDFVVHY